jgi:hypothetical protein
MEQGTLLDLHTLLRGLDIPSLLIGALLGAFFSVWYQYFVSRPRLAIVGSGGGGGPGPGFHQQHIMVRNEPGLLGLRIRETTILGIRVHTHLEWGHVIDRSPAHE